MRQEQIKRKKTERREDQDPEPDSRAKQDGTAELSARTAAFLRKLG